MDRIKRGLYAITQQGLPEASLLEKTRDIAQSGAVMLQYRAKADSDRRAARALLDICRKFKVMYIVNDDPQLARDIGADGVHLGADDADVTRARAILDNDAIIGVSCYNALERAIQAERMGADYVAFGSFFDSITKPDAVRADPALLAQAKDRLSIPIAAIGGITPENGKSLLDAGADLLAVISGVYAASDTSTAAARYSALFTENY